MENNFKSIKIETIEERTARLFKNAMLKYYKKYSKVEGVTSEDEISLFDMVENTAYTYALTIENLYACIEQIDTMVYNHPEVNSNDYILLVCDVLAEVNETISKTYENGIDLS